MEKFQPRRGSHSARRVGHIAAEAEFSFPKGAGRPPHEPGRRRLRANSTLEVRSRGRRHQPVEHAPTRGGFKGSHSGPESHRLVSARKITRLTSTGSLGGLRLPGSGELGWRQGRSTQHAVTSCGLKGGRGYPENRGTTQALLWRRCVHSILGVRDVQGT